MGLELILALAKSIFFLLTLINSTCLGDGCISDPSIVTGPSNASILQGSNRTFWCKGTGSYIEWEINGIPVYKLSEETVLQVVSIGAPAAGDCTQESMLTVHAKTVPEHNTLSTVAVQCVMKKGYHAAVVSEAYLKVHVIGGAGDVELISPASPEGPAIIQWNAPDVLSGSSSPLYYNITVRDPSNQTIAQNTTTDSSFAIDSDLLVPCQSYELTLLPFQQISNHTELGIMTQTTKNYSGTPLPATNIKFSVSLEPDGANVAIYFKVNFTSCSPQWPEKYTLKVLEQGTNPTEIMQEVEQAVMGMENEYTLENLDLRGKYQVSIKLQNYFSSSVAKTANFSTFNVQNLLTEQKDSHELNVHCEMAKGAEDKDCTVMMSNKTRDLLWNCKTSGGRDATCNLSELTSGNYLIQGYDQELRDTPAIERAFLFNKSNGDSPSIAPTTRTDDATTVESSPRFVEVTDEESLQTGLILGITVPLIFLGITVGLVSIIVFLVVMKFRIRKKNYDLRDTEATHTEVHVYPTAEENAYHEHNILWQQDTPTEPTVVQEPAYAEAQTPIGGNAREHNLPWQQSAVTESTDIQEPAYADAQTMISSTAPTTNNSHNQYREHRKEWLAYLPHTISLIHTPDGVSL